MLMLVPLWWSEMNVDSARLKSDLPLFLWMALLPGLLALFIYYKGLQVTRATVACWLELSYPLMAVLINWIFLGSTLNLLQIAGGFLLIASVSMMSYQSARSGDLPT